MSERTGGTGIWTISYIGGDPVFLTPLEGNILNIRLLKWGIDSNEIFIEKDGKLASVNISESKVADIGVPNVDGAKQLQISSDENKIAYTIMSAGVDQVWIQSRDGKGSATQISNAGFSSNFPAWYTDSESVAFASNQTGTYQIYFYNLPTESLFQITDNPHRSLVPMISTDGSRVFYLASETFDND